MIYNELFFNKRDWLIENYSQLKINQSQLIVLLMIDAANQQSREITFEYLSGKTKLNMNNLNKTVDELIDKKFLEIIPKRNKVQFSINGIFNAIDQYMSVNHDLLQVIQKEFGRLLSQNELIRLNDLSQKYSLTQLNYGIREAIVHRAFSLDYIERVIINEAK